MEQASSPQLFERAVEERCQDVSQQFPDVASEVLQVLSAHLTQGREGPGDGGFAGAVPANQARGD